MATLELGLFPLTQLKRPQEEHHLLHHHPHQHQKKKQKVMTMLSYIQPAGKDLVAATNDDDDSWEVRAFAEDTSNIMGTTWPPRFYACSFCRRQFRSAQALGGHMNVHRRDRARAQMQARPAQHPIIFAEAAAGSGSGFCFVYPVVAGPGQTRPSTKDSSASSTFFSLSSSSSYNNVGTISFGATASDFSLIRTSSDDHSKDENDEEELTIEEVDLELRLGC